MRSPARQPTMADVAARAGVSHQTVSRVLNDLPGVREETALRVQQAIAELGYRRNRSARLLASRRSGLVGVATWGTSHFGPQQTQLQLDLAAREAGFRLTTVAIRDLVIDDVREAVDELLEQGVEAVVLLLPHDSVVRFVQQVELGVPVVVVEGDPSRTPLSVAVDNVQGARLATRHLLELGHHTVTHVAGPPGWAQTAARIEGWRTELEEWGRPVPPLRWGGDWSADSGFAAGSALAREREVTAVFTANDQMAMGLMAALREAGRRVPADVSVVGFDDLAESVYFDPPLTSVRQDFGELGRRSMSLVTRALAGEVGPVVDLVPTQLVVRASTARWAS
ncbi:LacI family DNA-binding transcriptional regulator [Nocardioides ferulae]|uniref:LacI family DNA-binding transcriptional regulator n=1 Tax=Nocardioides ferulae TaxID=2340821 RepID=UPI000EB40CD4|nr:LacI family DNA-binding transcriptional regulator [Nocardioides ferulae]